MIFPLVILVLIVPGRDASTAGRVSLGRVSFEVPQGWDVSVEKKRIIGKPTGSGDAPSKDWFMPSSELFVMLGPEPDSGRELSETLKKFIENTFVGYDEIELKSFKLKHPAGIESQGFSGSMRNRYSGDILFAVVMILRHKGSLYFFAYNIDREDRFRDFSKGALILIMDSLKTSVEFEKGAGKSDRDGPHQGGTWISRIHIHPQNKSLVFPK